MKGRATEREARFAAQSQLAANIRSLAAVRFRRNVASGMNHYSQNVMAYVVDIDARTARFGLHAGRLQAGG